MSRALAIPMPALSNDQRRDLLHLLLAFSMLFSTVSPALTTLSLPVFNVGGGAISRPVVEPLALQGLSSEGRLAPYLPGKEPDLAGLTLSAPVDSVSAPAATPPFSFDLPRWSRPLAAAAAVPLTLGGTILPDWLSSGVSSSSSPALALQPMDGQELGDALLPGWLGNLPGIDDLPGLADPVGDALPAAPAGRRPAELAWQPVAAALPGWFSLANIEPILSVSPQLDRSSPMAPLNGAAACIDAGDLAIVLTKPAYVVSRGNLYGDVYTVTVANNVTATVTEVSLLVDPNLGFYYLGNSATVVSSLDGVLTYADSGTTTPDASATISLTGDITQTSLAAGEIITFTYKMATDGDAVSAQRHQVYLQSGDDPAPASCDTDFDNIQTARGNMLLTSYTPSGQSAAFGEQVSWTVVIENSGLGNVYVPVIDVSFGPGLVDADLSQLPSVSNPLTIPVGGTVSYVFTATVGACTGLTNSIGAWWNIGNATATIDGQATQGDPLDGSAYVNFLYDLPNISLAVSPNNIDVPYCNPLGTEQIQVIASNSAGAAANFTLAFANATGGTVENVDPNWSYGGGIFTYLGGSPAGSIVGGGSATLTFDLTGAQACNATSTTAYSFTPNFQEACGTPRTAASAGGTISYAQDEASIGVNKSGPVEATAGDIISFTIDLSASFIENITDTIIVTDLLPAVFSVEAITVPVGTSFEQDGQLITWTVPTPGSGNGSWRMIMDVLVREDSCDAYSTVLNRVFASANGCATCGDVYTASDTHRLYIQDFDGISGFNKTTSGDYEVCESTGYTVTNNYTLQRAITWIGTVFTETLGSEELAAVVAYEIGSAQVLLGGVDRTSEVTVSNTSPLVLDMSALQADLAIAKTSETLTATAGDTVTYTLSVTNTGQGTAASVIVTDVLTDGLTYADASASQGTCDTSVVCDLGALGPGASATIIVTATVDAGRTVDVVNVAYVAGDALGLDGLQINNLAAIRTVITQTALFTATDLAVSQTVTPAIDYAGQPMTYTVVITNLGPYTASNVTLIDALPMSFTVSLIEVSQGTGCNFGDLVGVCDLGEVGIGATATVTFVVSTDAAFGSEVVNFAAVSASNEDLDLSNNSATAESQVLADLELEITYRLIPQEASLGTNVSTSFYDWSILTLGGSSGVGACLGNSTYYQGEFTGILRGDLGLDLVASQPDACVAEQVRLDVTGGTVTELTDSLIVTMTLGAGDVYTVAGYGGIFALLPPPTVISSSNVITWSWPASTAITDARLHFCGRAATM